MKRFSRSKKGFALTSAVLLLLFCALILPSTVRLQVHAHSYATQPSLGTAGNFAVLGGSTVTNTGPTVVTGDLGVSPGAAVTGFPPGIVNGAIHAADAVALQAQNDVAIAYENAAGQPCAARLTGQDLGGQNLTSGVYCFASSAQLTGQLTLNGQDNPASVFIFQIGNSLTTASSASVLLINGAQPCNIFWQVGSYATLGTSTSFTGNIMALSSISFTIGARSNGGLYTRNGAVTLDTNMITQSPCASGITPTSLPTDTPTSLPTDTPTSLPTDTPTSIPTGTSTSIPTGTSTSLPTGTSTSIPTGTSTSIPTGTSTSIPTGTSTSIPTGTSTSLPTTGTINSTHVPDLSITNTHLQINHEVTYTLTVTNAETAGLVVSPNSITVADIIPIGEKNLQAFGSSWSFTSSSTTSPAIITATFLGPFPVSAGESLPPITITAILTKDAVPNITDTATVDTLGNIGTNSTAIDTIFVEEQQNNQHCDNNSDCTSNSNGVENNSSNSNNHSNNVENNSGTKSNQNGTPGMPFTGSNPTSY